MEKLYARYSANASGAPIRSRSIKTTGKPNNRIENNFFKKIVDAKVGYYASKIDYQLDKNEYKIEKKSIIEKVKGLFKPKEKKEIQINPEYDVHSNLIQEFLIRSNIKKLDSTVAKMAGICGYGVKNLYLADGVLYSQSLNPWECIFISDTERPKYCLRYYQTLVLSDEGLTPKIKIDFYDDKKIYSYLENKSLFTDSSLVFLGEQAHMLDGLPMIQFENNSEIAPDCDESVLSLVDSYDICLSDGVNEIDGLAQAYLVLVNMVLGNDSDEARATLDAMKQAGVIQIGENGQAFFITKNINDTFFENILNRLEENIYTFSSSINMNDENFANNTSGVAMKYKLLALETVSMISENEFKAASLDMFKIASNYWKLKTMDINYLNIFMNMKRNFPLDVESEARANGQLKGLVSEETRLSQLSFVDDVQYEIERMEEEKKNENNPYDLDQNIEEEETPADNMAVDIKDSETPNA